MLRSRFLWKGLGQRDEVRADSSLFTEIWWSHGIYSICLFGMVLVGDIFEYQETMHPIQRVGITPLMAQTFSPHLSRPLYLPSNLWWHWCNLSIHIRQDKHQCITIDTFNPCMILAEVFVVVIFKLRRKCGYKRAQGHCAQPTLRHLHHSPHISRKYPYLFTAYMDVSMKESIQELIVRHPMLAYSWGGHPQLRRKISHSKNYVEISLL